MDPKSPPKKSKAIYTPPISARLDPEIREAIEAYAKKKDITFSRALETLARCGLEGQKEIARTFGGKHNHGLAWLISRAATGVEHARRKKWLSDTRGAFAEFDREGFFQIMLAVLRLMRNFLGNDWERSIEEQIQDTAVGVDVSNDIRTSLNDPDALWWPLSHGEPDETVLPVRKLSALMGGLLTGDDPALGLAEPFRRMVIDYETRMLEKFARQGATHALKFIQDLIVKEGHDPFTMTGDELSVAINELVIKEGLVVMKSQKKKGKAGAAGVEEMTLEEMIGKVEKMKRQAA